MQENTTSKGQPGDTYDEKSLKNSSLIFARALGLILSEGEGVVVDIVNDINLGEDVKKVIVLNHDSQIHIFKCEEDLSEGTPVKMGDPTSEEKTEE